MIETSYSNARTAPSGLNGASYSGANLPKMHSNAHYRDIKTASSAGLFRIGGGGNSPRLPAINRRTEEPLQSQEEDPFIESQPQQRSDFIVIDSTSNNIPTTSPSVANDQYDQIQQFDSLGDRSSEPIDDFMNALDPLALSGFNNTNRNISFQSTSNPKTADNNEPDEDSDEDRDPSDDACNHRITCLVYTWSIFVCFNCHGDSR